MEVKPPVAVVLKRKPILPLCTKVVDECRNNCFSAIEFVCTDPSINHKTKLWFDSVLLKNSLYEILTDAARHCDEKEPIRLTACSIGMEYCRLIISYLLSESVEEGFYATSGYPYFFSEHTREIILQHRARINFRRIGKKINITITFER